MKITTFLLCLLSFILGYIYCYNQWKTNEVMNCINLIDQNFSLYYTICYEDKFNLNKGEVFYTGFEDKIYKIRRIR